MLQAERTVVGIVTLIMLLGLLTTTCENERSRKPRIKSGSDSIDTSVSEFESETASVMSRVICRRAGALRVRDFGDGGGAGSAGLLPMALSRVRQEPRAGSRIDHAEHAWRPVLLPYGILSGSWGMT